MMDKASAGVFFLFLLWLYTADPIMAKSKVTFKGLTIWSES